MIWQAFGTAATTRSKRISRADTPSTIGRRIRSPRSRRGACGGRREGRFHRRGGLVSTADRGSSVRAVAARNVRGAAGARGRHGNRRRQRSDISVSSTILCAAIALAFRLNQPAIQIAQAAMAPTQLMLIVPFVRLGEWLLRAPRQPAPSRRCWRPSRRAARAAVVLRDAVIDAAFAWMVVAPAATFPIYKRVAPAFVAPPGGSPAAPGLRICSPSLAAVITAVPLDLQGSVIDSKALL